jgi:RHS repeat-associated protein
VNPFLGTSNQYEVSPDYFTNMKNEWYIYGSSGHGRFACSFPVGNDGGYDNLFYPSPTIQSRYLKHKQYELKDHLGNVRVVVSDLKQSTTSGTDDPPYRAEVLAVYNYYPFGMLQPGMYAENDDKRYRFGFNGMLRDDDMTDKLSTVPDEGRGNSYDFGARMYNPRVTRFFGLDPLRLKYPSVSSYIYALNSPINAIDPDGRVVIFFNGQHGGSGGSSEYWGGFDQRVMNQIGDQKAIYRDGAIGGWNSTFPLISNSIKAVADFESGLRRGQIVNTTFSGGQSNISMENRINAGRRQGVADAFSIFSALESNESIKIITHSMGAAHSRGWVEGVMSKVDDWNAANPDRQLDPSKLIELQVDASPFQGPLLPNMNENIGKKYYMSNWWGSDLPGQPLFDKDAESLPIPLDKNHSINTFPVDRIPPSERNGSQSRDENP